MSLSVSLAVCSLVLIQQVVRVEAATPTSIPVQVQRAVETRQRQRNSAGETQLQPVSTHSLNVTGTADDIQNEQRVITRYSWFNGLIKIRQHGSQYYLRVL